jgi:hypothetical protein
MLAYDTLKFTLSPDVNAMGELLQSSITEKFCAELLPFISNVLVVLVVSPLIDNARRKD